MCVSQAQYMFIKKNEASTNFDQKQKLHVTVILYGYYELLYHLCVNTKFRLDLLSSHI